MNTYRIDNAASTYREFVAVIDGIEWVGATALSPDFPNSLVTTDGTTADARATLQPAPPSRKAELITQLDTDCDDIYFKVLGFRDIEYINAEAQAREFKARAYADPVPDLVAVYAAGAGMSAQDAADYAIALSDAWRPAMAAIRMYRTQAKTALVAAQDATQEDAVMAGWSAFVTNIKTQLGIS